MRTKILLIIISLTMAVSAQITFEKWYGGEQEEEGRAVEQTTDGGYIFVASTRSYGAGNFDIYLIRTDSNGDTIWTRTFGGTGYDTAADVLQTNDGGFIIAGYTSSVNNGDIYLVRTDNHGDTLWTKTIGGFYNDHVKDMQKTTDGGFILGGDIDEGGTSKYYLVKIDSFGDTLWTKSYYYGQVYSVQQTSGGGYILAVYPYTDPSGITDMKIVKTDNFGNISWIKTYGGSDYDMSFAIQQTSEGGYIVGGRTDSFGAGASDFILLKINSDGDSLWAKTYGGTADERAFAVKQLQDGGYIVAGYTATFGEGSTDFYLVRTDGNGDTLWTRTHGGNHQEMLNDLKLTDDGGFIAVGHTYSFGQVSNPDAYVVKTNSEGIVTNVIERSNNIPTEFSLSQNYPNPFNPSTKISWQQPVGGLVTLKIYDVLGREFTTLVNEELTAGTHETIFDASRFSSGVYFYQLNAGDYIQTKKMILLK